MLSRADEGLLLRAEDVDLDDLVRQEAARLRTAHPDRRIVLDSVQPARLQGDSASLSRVLRNLGDNAARHAREPIHLAVAVVAGETVVTVTDDGPGVPPADRERIFERFVRLDDARDRERGGTGLGLALCREVVRAHGGSIAVQGDQPGATFVVRLPLAPA